MAGVGFVFGFVSAEEAKKVGRDVQNLGRVVVQVYPRQQRLSLSPRSGGGVGRCGTSSKVR